MQNLNNEEVVNSETAHAIAQDLSKVAKNASAADFENIFDKHESLNLETLNASRGIGNKISRSSERAIAAWINSAIFAKHAYNVTDKHQWYDIKDGMTGAMAALINPHKTTFKTINQKHSNWSTIWGRVRKYAQELAEQQHADTVVPFREAQAKAKAQAAEAEAQKQMDEQIEALTIEIAAAHDDNRRDEIQAEIDYFETHEAEGRSAVDIIAREMSEDGRLLTAEEVAAAAEVQPETTRDNNGSARRDMFERALTEVYKIWAMLNHPDNKDAITSHPKADQLSKSIEGLESGIRALTGVDNVNDSQETIKSMVARFKK